MTGHPHRAAIRWGVPLLLLASCAGATAVSMHATDVPTLALGSHVVLALQSALVFFYGSLLLFVPLVRALSDGELPIELTLRGARWSEEVLGFGDELTARRRDEEKRVARAESELREEVKVLSERLESLDRSQKELFCETATRIAAFEEKV